MIPEKPAWDLNVLAKKDLDREKDFPKIERLFRSPSPKYLSPVANVRVHDSLTHGFEHVEISNCLDFHQGRAVGLPEFQRAQANQNPLPAGDATVSQNGRISCSIPMPSIASISVLARHGHGSKERHTSGWEASTSSEAHCRLSLRERLISALRTFRGAKGDYGLVSPAKPVN